ncbi:MAG TPA: MIP/aquaporin family protein [Thermoanaerobaculia bacterium]|nr:MIP/aquaporin family protein [Thermoanaerobaculia bacterium]
MQAFVAELVGTMILVILGDGVVANVVLQRTKGNQGGWIVITTGWGLAVALAVYCVGRISGAHLNPAVSIGLAAIGQFEWSLVANYIVAQMIGAILGAIVVWLAYLPHFAVTEDQGLKLGVFCTRPSIRSLGANFLTELIGTALLLFGILAIAANANEFVGEPGGVDLSVVFATGLNPLLVGFLVWGIGLSLGGPTGYAINPARDLGPRIAHAILPISDKGDSEWGYALVPILGPIVGGILGAVAFRFVSSNW